MGRGEGVGGQRLGMFIFWEGWFRVGVRLRVGNVNIGGGGPCRGGATGGLGTAMGDANIMKGWDVLRQTLDMLILLGVGGLRQRLGKFNIQWVFFCET